MNGQATISNPSGQPLLEILFNSGEEKKLESLLELHPTVLPISEINPLANVAVPIGRQVNTAVGQMDLLFLDDAGRLLIIECKLIQNPEARRDVVAQVLEYSSRIETTWDAEWVMSLGEEYYRDDAVSGVVGAMNNALSRRKDCQPLTAEELKRRITAGLSSRSKGPILVIVGNRLEQRALVLVDYLRKQKVPICCVEIRRFKTGETEFMLGIVKAASLLSTVTQIQRASINEEEWLALVEDPTLRIVRRKVLALMNEIGKLDGCVVSFGSKELKLGLDGYKIAAVSENLFYVYLSGLRELGWDDSQITALRDQIEPIIGTRLSSAKSYPSFSLSLLSDSNRMAGFSEFLRSLVNTGQ